MPNITLCQAFLPFEQSIAIVQMGWHARPSREIDGALAAENINFVNFGALRSKGRGIARP